MTTAALIILERSSRWAGAFARLAEARDLRLTETRRRSDCRDAVAAAPASILAVELRRDNAAETLSWLAEITADFPDVVVVGLLEASSLPLELAIRTAGAVAVVDSAFGLPPIVRWATARLAGFDSPTDRLEDRVWRELPWSAVPRTA